MTTEACVRLHKTIPAPRAEVFEAWLAPALLERFMCPAEGASVSRVEVDAREGGAFLIVMRVGDRELPHRGSYRTIERYERLVFTWLSHLAGEGSEVSLFFADSGDGQTLLTLEHRGLESGAITPHSDGWTHIVHSLVEALRRSRAGS